jgi:PTH1 family peptidyl-tRNA hydrolase
MSISLVAGLGNPGREYELSRHNLGWVVVDAYASKHGLSWRNAPEFDSVVAREDLGAGRTLWFVKPQTFMNESGRAVAALARYHRIDPEAVAAVYDDLTIDLGLVKVSVTDLKDFVLARFTTEQLTLIQQKTDTYVKGLELLLASGADRAMNQLNRRDIP